MSLLTLLVPPAVVVALVALVVHVCGRPPRKKGGQ
jgi:hypothetical protein